MSIHGDMIQEYMAENAALRAENERLKAALAHRDPKPEHVFLVKDGAGYYWKSHDDLGDSWTQTQRHAHRFAHRVYAYHLAKRIRANGASAHVIRLRVSPPASPSTKMRGTP